MIISTLITECRRNDDSVKAEGTGSLPEICAVFAEKNQNISYEVLERIDCGFVDELLIIVRFYFISFLCFLFG